MDLRIDQATRFLNDRLIKVALRGILARSVGSNRASEARIGRFLRKWNVTEEKIVGQSSLGTAERVNGQYIPAIQDTTSFRDKGSGTSQAGHTAIAVEVEQVRCTLWSMYGSLITSAAAASSLLL